MRKSMSPDGVVEDCELTCPPDQDTSESSRTIILPDPKVRRPIRVYNPRMVRREDAHRFLMKEVIEEPIDAAG